MHDSNDMGRVSMFVWSIITLATIDHVRVLAPGSCEPSENRNYASVYCPSIYDGSYCKGKNMTFD